MKLIKKDGIKEKEDDHKVNTYIMWKTIIGGRGKGLTS